MNISDSLRPLHGWGDWRPVFIAHVTFGRSGHILNGPAKAIEGDTIVVVGELVRLHGWTRPNWI